jgi:DNA-binding CsgD family transcriptional regulator
VFRLLPREEKFFDLFEQQAGHIVTASRVLEELTLDYPDAKAKAERIRDIEHAGDTLTHEIVRRLNTSFVTPIDRDGSDVAVSIREIGTTMGAFSQRYRLSRREAQIVELVLLGYRNRDIAGTLGTSPATIKKHLTHVFDKVGVDTRTQLVSRIA